MGTRRQRNSKERTRCRMNGKGKFLSNALGGHREREEYKKNSGLDHGLHSTAACRSCRLPVQFSLANSSGDLRVDEKFLVGVPLILKAIGHRRQIGNALCLFVMLS